jgi:hypothetical protein
MLVPMIGDGQTGAAINLVGRAVNPHAWTTAPLFIMRAESAEPAPPMNDASAMAPRSEGLFVHFADMGRRP